MEAEPVQIILDIILWEEEGMLSKIREDLVVSIIVQGLVDPLLHRFPYIKRENHLITQIPVTIAMSGIIVTSNNLQIIDITMGASKAINPSNIIIDPKFHLLHKSILDPPSRPCIIPIMLSDRYNSNPHLKLTAEVELAVNNNNISNSNSLTPEHTVMKVN